MSEVTYTIGGEAGQGVESSGAGFARAHARAGYHVFALQEYESRIRGGHNIYQVRASDQPVRAHSRHHSVLIALDDDTIPNCLKDVRPGGAVIYDAERKDVDAAAIEAAGARAVGAPLKEIATTVGSDKIMANTVALSIASALSGFDFAAVEEVIRENFARKGEAAVDTNLAVARAGYEWGLQHVDDFPHRLPPAPNGNGRPMLVHGNQGVVLGAIAAGCKAVGGYPMTPWSSVLEYLTESRNLGIVAQQTEDEIAAISFALGASWGGARALTGSSGGGFALMVEHLSLAGMNEVPLVVIEVQRAGPATGLATRSEQSDLLFALHAGHGEFPMIVTALKDPVDAYYRTARAFNLAEQYQCVVMVLSDLHTSNSLLSAPTAAMDYDTVVAQIDRGKTLTHEQLDDMPNGYERYAFSEDGISPRAIPGHANALVHGMSDEHDESGAITEESINRTKMVQKRMRKLDGAREQMEPPEVYGPATAPLSMVGWGGTYGTLREVVDRSDGRVNLIHYTDLQPFPAEGARPLQEAKRLVAVEQNFTGQLARYLRAQTGIEISQKIIKYDGRQMSPEWVLERLEGIAG